ncbi:MAG: phage holin family protein [Rhodocyclaceae bacterium]|nr:phage holin family protein [Rhodocyclaceae bacterium]
MSAPRRGWAERLAAIAEHALALAQTRLELLSLELREAGVRYGAALALAAAALFFLGFGVVLLALFLTVLLWDSHRLLPLAVFTTLFLVTGVFCALLARARARARPDERLLGATLDELARDREALTPGRRPGT